MIEAASQAEAKNYSNTAKMFWAPAPIKDDIFDATYHSLPGCYHSKATSKRSSRKKGTKNGDAAFQNCEQLAFP